MHSYLDKLATLAVVAFTLLGFVASVMEKCEHFSATLGS